MICLDWKIWYGDGATFTNEDGPPENAPTLDVQFIVEKNDKHNRRVWRGKDYYWYDEGWSGGDLFGLYDYLARGGLKIVKFGRVIPDDDVYDGIWKNVNDDPDFGSKTGGLDRFEPPKERP